MNPSDDLQSACDEVLRKIGRNLLLFQQAEQLIKRLISIGSPATRHGEAAESIEQRAAICQKMTMGQLTNLFLDRHCAEQAPSLAEDPDPEREAARISVHLSLGDPSGSPESRRLALATMVAERNELVHQLHLTLDCDSLESCREVAGRLDEQRRKILPEIHHLQQNLIDVRTEMDAILNHLNHPKGMEELYLPELQQCPLIRNLVTFASGSTDPEGWMALGPAIKQLKDFPKEKIDALLAQFGKKSLTTLLAASQLVDTSLEPSGNGSHRTLFRLKPTPAPKLQPLP